MSYYEDILLGVHCYIKNGVTIENNLALFPNLSLNILGSIRLYSSCPDGTCSNDVQGSIKDITKNKFGKLELNYNNSVPPRFTWDLRNLGDVFVQIQGQPEPDMYLTLPLEGTFVKQP
jgi:hypothetical protein